MCLSPVICPHSASAARAFPCTNTLLQHYSTAVSAPAVQGHCILPIYRSAEGRHAFASVNAIVAEIVFAQVIILFTGIK